MLLNKHQAEAVYSAMCALNNVGGRITAEMQDGPLAPSTRITEDHTGVYVTRNVGGIVRDAERYASQSDFAVAYGVA